MASDDEIESKVGIISSATDLSCLEVGMQEVCVPDGRWQQKYTIAHLGHQERIQCLGNVGEGAKSLTVQAHFH